MWGLGNDRSIGEVLIIVKGLVGRHVLSMLGHRFWRGKLTCNNSCNCGVCGITPSRMGEGLLGEGLLGLLGAFPAFELRANIGDDVLAGGIGSS